MPTKFGFKFDDPEELAGVITPEEVLELEDVELQKSASGSEEVPVTHTDVHSPLRDTHFGVPLSAGHFTGRELLQIGLLLPELQLLQNGESV